MVRKGMAYHRTTIVSILLLLPAALLILPAFATAQPLICTKVIDAYTIVLGNHESVRLIGMVSPMLTKQPGKQIEHTAIEAFSFTKRMVEGKPIRLEYDRQQRDTVGRTLAYVYLMDNTFLNAEIIKQGYGQVDTQHPCKYIDQFRQYEKEAREKKKGLWAEEKPGKERKLIKEEYIGSQQLKIYHKPYCALVLKIPSADNREFISVKDAVDAGYKPCTICRPPYYKR